jgi:hypothetical protein
MPYQYSGLPPGREFADGVHRESRPESGGASREEEPVTGPRGLNVRESKYLFINL